MKTFQKRIADFLKIRSVRTKNIARHVFLSFLYKGGSILANFLMVPLTIQFLDVENYGVWLTLSSFVAWFSFFDIGLGNGLRNKFAEANAEGDLKSIIGYISTAYFSITLICLILFIVCLVVNFGVDWSIVFNTSETLNEQLTALMPVVFGCFCIQLILKLVTSIYTADQKPSIQGKVGFITATSSLLLIWLLTQTDSSSLFLFGIIFSIIPVLVLLTLNIVAFKGPYKKYKPRIAFWKMKYFQDIFGLGLSFFIIQMSGIVLFSTDNFIITQLLGPEEVVPYNVAYKYISIALMILTIVLTPYWSSITDAYVRKEFEWIRKSMKNLLKISLLAILSILVLILGSPLAYRLWIGDSVVVPFSLTLWMGVYFMITIMYSPFTMFINGTGKIRMQMITVSITAMINIPLSVFLVKHTTFGATGVILATILCILPYSILCPIQYHKILNNKATGLWNK